MTKSLAWMRRSGSALLGVALLAAGAGVAGACGDDTEDPVIGDDGGNETPEDSGGAGPVDNDAGPGPIDAGPGPIDAGPGPIDAGPNQVPDSGAEAVAAALRKDGENATSQRADLVFPLACQNAVKCELRDDASGCITETRASYEVGVSKGFSTACLDATLDFWACQAEAACDKFDDDCTTFYETQLDKCPELRDAGT